VNLEVVPLTPPGNERHYLVVFEDAPAARAGHGQAGGAREGRDIKIAKGGRRTTGAAKQRRGRAADDDEEVRTLQAELASSREYMQSVIQDLEATNEELQSANEEILSANEELQSANEELDTAKEELQSTNEELNTLNDELQGRNDETSRVNGDLLNLLANVNIAIVMVASDLRIRRFTPTAEKVLNLIPTDVGRPFSDIKPNVDCEDIDELIGEAIDTVSMKERACRDRQGRAYVLRVRPYKNLENKIDGAVLTLVEVDEAGRARRESEARADASDRSARASGARADYAEAVIEVAREPMLVLDDDLVVRAANGAFRRAFGVVVGDAEGRPLAEVLGGEGGYDGEQVDLAGALRRVMDLDSVEDYRVEHEVPGTGRRTFLVNARRVGGGTDRRTRVLLAISEVTGAMSPDDGETAATDGEPSGQGGTE
jgi:two-component system CheB/CheR fusion protein